MKLTPQMERMLLWTAARLGSVLVANLNSRIVRGLIERGLLEVTPRPGGRSVVGVTKAGHDLAVQINAAAGGDPTDICPWDL